MMPVFSPGSPPGTGRSAAGCSRADRQQQDDGQRQHDPEQLDTEQMSCQISTDSPNEAPSDSATVPTMTSAATRLRVMNIITSRIRLSAAIPRS